MTNLPAATTDVTVPWGATVRAFVADRSLEPEFFATGVYEATETAILQRLIRPGMTVLDVGGGFGYHAVLASRSVGPTGHVVAVEPEPANFALLEHNMRVNDCTNVRCLPVAVDETEGTTRLVRSATNFGRHSFYDANVVNPGNALDVACTTVDCLVETHLPEGRLDLLKIDAEGAEARILRGAERTLAQADLTIWMEIWPRGLRAGGDDSRRLVGWLESLGFTYRPYLFDGQFQLVAASRAAALAEPSIQYGCFVRST